MVKQRRRGNGSIHEFNGRHHVRAPDRKRTFLGSFATREEAAAVLDGALRLAAAAGPPIGDLTVADFGEKVLDDRDAAGYRGVGAERRSFEKHIRTSTLGRLPLATVGPRDVRDFTKEMGRAPAADRRGARTVSHHTVKRALTIVSAIFSSAVEKGYVEQNPCAGVKVRRPANAAATREAWTFLTAAEQDAVRNGPIPEAEKMIILFALGSGLRQGELWNLELADLHVADDAQGGPHVVVRFGSKGKPPKNGKIRRVPLTPIALEAARRWLELLPTYIRGKHAETRNFARLVFPGVRGSRRQCGKFGRYDDLRKHLAACGISRPFRFHDLRHSCASSLVGGFWGRTWTLHEVCALLGHSSITVTERYAHVGADFLTRAAAETRAASISLSCGNRERVAAPTVSQVRETMSPFSDLNRRPALYEGVTQANDSEGLGLVELDASGFFTLKWA